MRSLLLAIKKIITLKEDSYNEDKLQSEDGTCLMKLYPRYLGVVPTTATNEQIEEVIDYFSTNFRVTNSDWGRQEFIDDVFFRICILLAATEEQIQIVEDSCAHNWANENGSKHTSSHRDSTQFKQTVLSLQHAIVDARKERHLIDRTKNVTFDEAGEKITGVAVVDAKLILSMSLIVSKFAVESILGLDYLSRGDEEDDDEEDEKLSNGETPKLKSGKTGYRKEAGKWHGGISTRKRDKKLYSGWCPTDLARLFDLERTLAMPFFSVSDDVTSILEWLPAAIFKALGELANQKKEGDTSSSDGASVMKAIVFYLTSTFPMKRKDYYRRLRISDYYFGSKSNYIIRTVIDQIVHNQNQVGGYLQRMIEQHEVNVPAVLTSISSNVRESLKNVLSPGGVVSECGKKIALAVKICGEGDDAVNAILDQAHREILQQRRHRSEAASSRSSSSRTSRSSARNSARPSQRRRTNSASTNNSVPSASSTSGSSSEGGSSPDSSTASRESSSSSRPLLLRCGPVDDLLRPICGLLSGSGLRITGRVRDVVLVLATEAMETLTFELLRNLNTTTFVNRLNSRLEYIKNNPEDEYFDDEVLVALNQIVLFEESEFETGSTLDWLHKQVIIGLNLIHSPNDCTLYHNTRMYAQITMMKRITTGDPNAHFLPSTDHYLHTWYNIVIGGDNFNRSISMSRYRTLPVIDPNNSTVFEPFALALFNSINCNPGDMRVRHETIDNSNHNNEMSRLNARDSNSRRGARPV